MGKNMQRGFKDLPGAFAPGGEGQGGVIEGMFGAGGPAGGPTGGTLSVRLNSLVDNTSPLAVGPDQDLGRGWYNLCIGL
jgi:hypothetical protein